MRLARLPRKGWRQRWLPYHFCTLSSSLFGRVPDDFKRLGNLIQYGWLIDRCRHFPIFVIGDFAYRASQDLPERFRQTLHAHSQFKRGDWPDFIANFLNAFGHDFRIGAIDPIIETNSAKGSSPFSASLTPSTAHSAISSWPASTSSMPPVDRR